MLSVNVKIKDTIVFIFLPYFMRVKTKLDNIFFPFAF